eukprot:TRINITY_DN59275_c0_g1_i1.p2 TRINITY_DN59275_c0_g1~~TRINITY_DN59275_c0_g1_i1.p2  ORF type:complete len:179 (-),score=16.26 TRINITY_DN59275_c0_g1_i1:17-496(-)
MPPALTPPARGLSWSMLLPTTQIDEPTDDERSCREATLDVAAETRAALDPNGRPLKCFDDSVRVSLAVVSDRCVMRGRGRRERPLGVASSVDGEEAPEDAGCSEFCGRSKMLNGKFAASLGTRKTALPGRSEEAIDTIAPQRRPPNLRLDWSSLERGSW